MNVLVDSSIWVAHFRKRNDMLVNLLGADQVLTHPMILGELACGTPPEPRQQTLGALGLLRVSHRATWDEVIAFIEREGLYGQGCGWVDINLLASTLMTQATKIWTLDKRLEKLAARFHVNF